MNYKYIFALSLTIALLSCSSNEQTKNTKSDQTLKEGHFYVDSFKSRITTQDTISKKPVPSIDTLSIKFDMVLARKDSLKLVLKNNKDKFYQLKSIESDPYVISDYTWYFDSIFNLVFFEGDLSEEGGSGYQYICYYDSSVLNFQYIKTFLGNGFKIDIWIKEQKSQYTKEHSDKGLFKYGFSTDVDPQQFKYKDYIEGFSEHDFNYDSRFIFKDSVYKESDYGMAMFREECKIDSLLFVHLFSEGSLEDNNKY